MSSGFIEIAALGQQDVHLTGSPSVTYFSSVYKRHTPFVLEAFEVPFKASSISMGQNNIVLIPPKGDLIRATTLKLSLPPLATYRQEWFWNEQPTAVLPTIIIDGQPYNATIPFALQYYSSNSTAFAEWSASLGGKVIYDANLDKFVITATNFVVVSDPNFTSLINSGVFWGFDPRNFSSSDGVGHLRYNAKNGQVIPDFTLEQAGWSRTIGEPINTLSGLFLRLNKAIDPEGYVNFLQRNGENLVWTNEDAPLAYVITPGGRINFTQAGLYMVRASFVASNGNGTILIGSDGADGVPNSTNFWRTNLNPDSTNTNIPYSIPIKVTDVTQNWYVYIQGSPIGPGSYISIQPIDDYCGPSTPSPSVTLLDNTVGYAFDPSSLGHNGGTISIVGNGIFTFNQIGQWLITGIINTPSISGTPSPSIITSVQLIQGSNLLFTYDASGQLSESSSEFSIPVVVTSKTTSYGIRLNTVNGKKGKVLSSSFISFTYLALPNGGTSMYPSGGLILPLNGYFFDLSNSQVVNPLYFTDFTRYGVENMISLDGSGNIQFNNVGTYMMTTYFPLCQYNPIFWDPAFNLNWEPTLAWPNMFLSKQNLTVTAFQSISTKPTMTLSSLFHSGTKLMFRVSMDRVVGRTHHTSVGIGNQDLDVANYLGSDQNSFGYFDSGTIFTGGSYSSPSGLPLLQTSNVVDIAVDTTANMMLWVRVDGGQWTSNTGGIGGNPDAGTNGFDIGFLNIGGDPYKFGVNVFYDRDALVPGQITYNTWASSLVTPASTAWDPLLAYPYLELSNQNLTVTGLELLTRDDHDHPPMLLSNVFPTGTKRMFSVTMNYVVGTQTVVGIGNLSSNTSNFLGNDSNSFGYFDTGLPYANGTIGSLTPGPLFVTRSVVDIAVDTTSNKMMWVRVDGGNWSSSDGGEGADPSTADRGFDISYCITGASYKFGVNVWYDGNGGQTTFNTTALYAPPTGFTFVPGVGKTTDFNVPQGFTFVPGVPGTNTVTDINSYSNVTQGDTWFENLGQAATVDPTGNVYVVSNGNIINQVAPDGQSSIFAGYKAGTVADGLGMSAILGNVGCMASDSIGSIYFGDGGLIRVASPGQFVRTLAGGGPNAAPYDSIGTNASFTLISAICVVGSNVVVNDDGYLRKLDLVTNQTQTFNDDSGWTTTIHQKLFYNVIASNNGRYIYAVQHASPHYITKIDTQSPNGDVYSGSGLFTGFFDSSRLNARFTNITCIYETATGLYICDSGRIRYLRFSTNQTYTLNSTFNFVQNPPDPYTSSITQFVVALRSFDPFDEFHPEDVIYTIQTQVKTLVSTLSGTGPNALKMSENTMYPVTIPVRVDSAPMSYPVTVGHDDQFFAPGAFVWVYPITSTALPTDYNQYHYYDSVGTWAIESADLKIGGQSIQTLSGEYIEIWNDLNIPYENQPALKLLTGKYDTTIATGRDYYVNLPFYFYGKSQNYLPMCSLSRQDVEIHITFRTLQALTAITVEPNPVQATIIVEYVYLNGPELNWFTKTRLEYVIDQAQYQEFDILAGTTQENFLLNFRNPVQALFFAIEVVGQVPYDWTNDGLEHLGLSFNGEEIVTNRITDTVQVGILEPFNNFINFPTRNFYMKTFESPINFSRIRYALLTLNMYRSDQYYPAKTLRITGISKNVLQISDGLGGLMFISQ